jgi:hypothetical protein
MRVLPRNKHFARLGWNSVRLCKVRMSWGVSFMLGFFLCGGLASACEGVPPVQLLPLQIDIVNKMMTQRELQLERVKNGMAQMLGADASQAISAIEKFYDERETLAIMRLCKKGKRKSGENERLKAQITIASQLFQELSMHFGVAKDLLMGGSVHSADVAAYEIAVLRAKLKLEALKLKTQ